MNKATYCPDCVHFGQYSRTCTGCQFPEYPNYTPDEKKVSRRKEWELEHPGKSFYQEGSWYFQELGY